VTNSKWIKSITLEYLKLAQWDHEIAHNFAVKAMAEGLPSEAIYHQAAQRRASEKVKNALALLCGFS